MKLIYTKLRGSHAQRLTKEGKENIQLAHPHNLVIHFTYIYPVAPNIIRSCKEIALVKFKKIL